jgi:hypothetical protein
MKYQRPAVEQRKPIQGALGELLRRGGGHRGGGPS